MHKEGFARQGTKGESMYEITSWDDIKRVAPSGARYFRYRRPTGERRKFYESGKAFPLDPEDLADGKPAHSEGVFAVYFYTEEEAAKPAAEARPLIIQPPDRDELLVEFPRGVQPGDNGDSLYKREQLITIKDLARSTAGPLDAMLKLLEKVSHERDLMAEEAEKNRIGPVWQLILEHHPQIKELLIAAAPILGAIAKAAAERLTNGGEVAPALAELRKSQDKQAKILTEHIKQSSKALTDVGKELAKIRQSQAKRLPPARPTKPRRAA